MTPTTMETMPPAALLEAAALLPDTGGYALAYGSHATGTHRPASDLDLLYTGPRPLPAPRAARLTSDVVALHRRHGLLLDEEVPYAVKLYASNDQVDQAIALGGFRTCWGSPPPTIREAWFLATDAFRLRLVFNVLTSPHVFLAGDVAAYRRHVRAAERGAFRLARSLHHGRPLPVHDAWRALWRAPDGRMGKDYLGYLVAPHLLSVLARGQADRPTLSAQLQPSR